MTRDRLTRLLHLLLAAGIAIQMIDALIMTHPKPGRAGDSFYALHEFWGQALLALLVILWIRTLTRSGGIASGLFFPWFSPSGYRAIHQDIRRYLDHLIRFRLPENSEPSPLSCAVQGLGLLAATALGVTGTAIFFGMEKNGALPGLLHALKEIHEGVGAAMWVYLLLHAGMGILHQWAGHDTLREMFDLRKLKHVKTGKVIDPLAPVANRDRLQDALKVEKCIK